MKSLLIPVLVLLAAACSPLSEQVRDAAVGPNGGFESARDGLPVNWIVYSPETVPEGRFELALDRTEPKEGAQSLRFDVEECVSTGGNRSPGIAREDAVEPGATYDVRFWVKNEGCDWRATVGGVAAKTGEHEVVAPPATSDGDWTPVEHRYTVPASYDRLRFELNVTSPGRLWIDDVRIEPVVLRAPLDGVSDALTVAIRPSVYVTYDLNGCRLQRVWRGELLVGGDEGGDPAQARMNVAATLSPGVPDVAWEAFRDGDQIECLAEYRGNETRPGEVSLLYVLYVGGREVSVRETTRLLDSEQMTELWREWTLDDDAELSGPTTHVTALHRRFELGDLSADVELCLSWLREVRTVTSWGGFEGRPDGRRAQDGDYERIALTALSKEASLHQLIVVEPVPEDWAWEH